MKNTHYAKSTQHTKNTNSRMRLLPYICCIVILLTSSLISKAQKYSASEIARWEQHAKQINLSGRNGQFSIHCQKIHQ